MYDGQGSKYQFSAEGAAAGVRLVNGDLYLLRSIIGPGGNSVQLDYTIGAPVLPGGAGLSIDLQSVSYNPNPARTCFKNKIVLSYDTAVTGNPLSMTLMGTTVLARVHKLTKIDVIDRPTACNADVALRTYTFKYQADTDTQQPRLQSVTIAGQAGTPERGATLPVAAYSYGSIVDPATNQITYEKTQSIAPPFHIGADTFLYGVSQSLAGSSPEPHSPSDVLTDLTTWQTLIDLNGDGRPDFFDETGFYRNTPGANGISTFSALGFSGAAVDARGLIHSVIPNGARSHDRVSDTSINDTLRMEIDMNGDGRVDVVETVPSDIDHWIVHLNTPDPADPGKIVWVDVKIPVAPMRAALNTTGLVFGRVPLARNTSLRSVFAHCWFWEGFNGRWQEDVVKGCSDIPAGFSLTKTITEFELKDVNGDGYPDFVFNASTVNVTDPVVKPPIPSNPMQSPACLTLVSPDMSGSHDIKVLINTAGAHLTDEANLFAAPPVTLEAGGATGCGIARWEPDLTITSTDTTTKINQTCGLQDVNGDGIVDRITSSTQNGQLTTTTALGTGDLNSPFAAEGTIQLPGPLRRTESTAFFIFRGLWETACLRSTTAQVLCRHSTHAGPARYQRRWHPGLRQPHTCIRRQCALDRGNGHRTGFTAPIDVVTIPLVWSFRLNPIFLSQPPDVERAHRNLDTLTGLYDVDGDGQPEACHSCHTGNPRYLRIALDFNRAQTQPPASGLGRHSQHSGSRTLDL